jgi:hypothetical protein
VYVRVTPLLLFVGCVQVIIEPYYHTTGMRGPNGPVRLTREVIKVRFLSVVSYRTRVVLPIPLALGQMFS